MSEEIKETVATEDSAEVAVQETQVEEPQQTEISEEEKPEPCVNETIGDEDEFFFTDGEEEEESELTEELPQTSESVQTEDKQEETPAEPVIEEKTEQDVDQEEFPVLESSEPVKQEAPSPDMQQAITERIKNEVKEDYIPNTKEFRDGVRAEAKQAVLDELGVDEYDPYDDEHQMLFIEKAQQISQRRTNAYMAAVSKFEREYRQNSFSLNLKATIDGICDTPQLQKALEDAVGGISHRAYLQLQKEIKNGNAEGLIKLAKAVKSKGTGSVKTAKPKQKVSAPSQPAKAEPNDEYVTEDFFSW